MHITGRKITQVFRDSLEFCVRASGRVPNHLYCVALALVHEWPADSQEIEGVMSLIANAVRVNPHISQPQLDARVGLRKYIGLGSRSTPHKKKLILWFGCDNVGLCLACFQKPLGPFTSSCALVFWCL